MVSVGLDMIQISTHQKLNAKYVGRISEYRIQHTETVQQCRNNKKCLYGDKRCWFRHGTQTCDEEKINKQNPEITKKIFKMLETFMERVVQGIF